jgi:hypothetical protein
MADDQTHPAADESAGAASASDTSAPVADTVGLRDGTRIPLDVPIRGDGEEDAPVPEGTTAIIYLPNLKQDPEAETIATVAHRIALAMDNISDERGASFSAVTAADAAYDGITTHTAIVRKKDAAGKQSDVIHLYEFDYRPTLLGGFQKRQPIVQAGQILLTLLGNMRNFAAAIIRPGQSIPQKAQVFYAGLLAIGMLFYMLMLLGTAAVTARQAAEVTPPSATREATKGPAPEAVAPAPGSVRTGAAAPATGTARSAASAGATKPTAKPRLRDLVKRPAWPLAARAVQPRTLPAMSPAPEAAPREKLPSFPVWLFQRAKFHVLTWGGYALGLAAFLITWPFLRIGEGVLIFWNMSTDRLHQLQSVVLTFTVLGLTVRVSLKEVLSRMSTTTTCASSYLAYGIGRNELVGHLARLLDHVGSREVKYRNVHLVGYSFGSIVALDCVYQDSDVSAAFDQVSTLSTIGCPADFIRTYWRDYFVDRHEAKHAPGKWVNVYAPRDVLASNFADGTVLGIGAADTEATMAVRSGRGIALTAYEHPSLMRRARSAVARTLRMDAARPARRSDVRVEKEGEEHTRLPTRHIKFGPAAPSGFVGWAFFIIAIHGFRAHERYWTRGINTAKTCWEPLLAEIYPYKRPPLKGVPATAAKPAAAPTPTAPEAPAPPAAAVVEHEAAAEPVETTIAVG